MKHIFFLMLVITTVLISISCKKSFLDPKPTDRLSEESVWKSKVLIEGVLLDGYTDLSDGFYSIGGVGNDNQMLSHISDETVSPGEAYEGRNVFTNGTLNADNVTQSLFNRLSWGNQFFFVSRINEFLARVPTSNVLNDGDKKLFIAEAKALKAFRYFNLLRRFGGLPLFDQPFHLGYDYSTVKRSTITETINFVIKNLDEAIADLPATAKVNGRLEKGAAMSIKSRVLLYAASPLYNESNDVSKWQAAADAAKAVIDLNKYALETNLENLRRMLHTYTPASKEMIFAWATLNNVGLGARRVGNTLDIPSAAGSIGALGRSYFMPLQQLVDAFETSSGRPITDPASGYNPQNPYLNRDPRFKAFIFSHGSLFNTRVMDYSETGLDGKTGSGGNVNATKYNMRKFVDESVFDQAGLQIGPRTGFTPTPWIHIRYAEILLNYAEAINEAQGPALAYKAINQIRSRAGMPDLLPGLSQSDMRLKIRNERRVELAFEEHRYYDVRRWKIAMETENFTITRVKITKRANQPDLYEYLTPVHPSIIAKRTFLSHQYFWPIPRTELFNSPGLKQNPGYQ